LLDQELISTATHLVVLVLVVEATIFKNASYNSVVSKQIGMKFGAIITRANARRLTESDLRFDVTLSTWQNWQPLRRMHQTAATW